MRRLPVLKTITNIFFILAVVAMIFVIPMCIMGMIMPERIPFKIHDTNIKDLNVEDWLLIFTEIVAIGFWVYALYLFKQLMVLFEKKKIFHENSIRNLDQIGKAILIGLAINVVARFLYASLVVHEVEVGIETNTFFTLILGFFFMVLSEVFLIAKNMKEDNELTI